MTRSAGSPKHFCSLVYGRLLDSGVKVPLGLPITFRACYLRWHGATLAKAAELLQDPHWFARPSDRSWLQRLIVPLIASAPHHGVHTTGDFFTAIQQAAQLASATHPQLSHLRGEMSQLSKETEQLETSRLANDGPKAESLAAPAADINRFVSERPDEQPAESDLNSFRWKAWQVSFASVKGPIAADKLENQDAVIVTPLRSTLVFALCDGVSTSYGARHGAALAAATFCSHLSQQLESPSPDAAARDSLDMLKAAASHVQEGLTALLDALLEDDAHEDWARLRSGSRLQRIVERKLCENTRAPQNGRSWAPVLATTLVGGFIEHSASGTNIHFMRLGDGVVELVGQVSPAVPLLAMNEKETAIDSVLCPGPKGRQSVQEAEVATGVISIGQSLVISSDGLIRGVSGTVSDELIRGDRRMQTAADILREACCRADQRNDETGGSHLYADNLSLFYMRHDEQSPGVPGFVDTRAGAAPRF